MNWISLSQRDGEPIDFRRRNSLFSSTDQLREDKVGLFFVNQVTERNYREFARQLQLRSGDWERRVKLEQAFTHEHRQLESVIFPMRPGIQQSVPMQFFCSQKKVVSLPGTISFEPASLVSSFLKRLGSTWPAELSRQLGSMEGNIFPSRMTHDHPVLSCAEDEAHILFASPQFRWAPTILSSRCLSHR